MKTHRKSECPHQDAMTLQAICKATDVADSTLHDAIAKGDIPAWREGRVWKLRPIDVAKYFAHSKASINRERLAKEQADRVALANRVLRWELIERAVVEAGNAEVAALFTQQLNAMPGRLATEVAALSDSARVYQRIRAETLRIREAISQRLLAKVAGSRKA